MDRLLVELGSEPMSRHQDPDDLICRPCTFQRFLPDGTVMKTFLVHHPFDTANIKTLGDLDVRETFEDVKVRIIMEENQ